MSKMKKKKKYRLIFNLLINILVNNWFIDFVMWPVRPRALLLENIRQKIPLWGPLAMVWAEPEKAARPRA